MKIGAITVGQAPRVDVMEDIMPLFEGRVEILERGALDGFDERQLKEVEPVKGDYILVSRLKDGTSVRMAEHKIIPYIQNSIAELEREKVQCILMLCTGKFPDDLLSTVPLIYPCDILSGVIPSFSRCGHIGVVVPDSSQYHQIYDRWKELFSEVTVAVASPYQKGKEIEEAGKILKKAAVDLIVLDCIGYTKEMKEKFIKITCKPVILPRTLAARVMLEYIDEMLD